MGEYGKHCDNAKKQIFQHFFAAATENDQLNRPYRTENPLLHFVYAYRADGSMPLLWGAIFQQYRHLSGWPGVHRRLLRLLPTHHHPRPH